MNYTGKLYIKLSEARYADSGKTGADWDELEAKAKKLDQAIERVKQLIAAESAAVSESAFAEQKARETMHRFRFYAFSEVKGILTAE